MDLKSNQARLISVAWVIFDEQGWVTLRKRRRARTKSARASWQKKAAERLHDYILFMVNTGLRPDEASRLEIRDVAIVTDEATGKRILEIEVPGKRGVGYCKSMPGAVLPFQRILKRLGEKPTNLLFGKVQRTGRTRTKKGPRRHPSHRLQPPPYVHMPPSPRRSRHLSDRKELPH